MKGSRSGARVAATGSAGIRPAQRIWLQDRGTPVFGMGIRELLIRVQATGSLRHAASDMGLAYSKAWKIVRRAEKHLGFTLLERQAGGTYGGGSDLSDEAKWLVAALGALVDEADTLLDELYARHFGDWQDRRDDNRDRVMAQVTTSTRQDSKDSVT